MNTRNIVKNIRSSVVIDGKPKLPTTDQLSEGEIAINYAEGYETLSFKNNSNEIVSLSVKTVDDITVNGSSVVSNKTANITMKGSTTPVANTYSTTTFPSPFESKAEHISASDKVDTALKKVETNISILASDVITNGTEVSSLKGDVNTIKGSINTITNDVNTIERNVTSIGGDYSSLQSTVGNLQSIINDLQLRIVGLEVTTNKLQIEYVDLGLPSGLKWANRNLGAVTEIECGYYFMWGSTKPNTDYDCTWAKAPFNNGSRDYDSTYFNSVKDTVCAGDNFIGEYDAASQIMGGDWRMPTEDDFQELINNTDNEWVTNYNTTGVSGRKFTSKKDSSKYIFIPASGRCYNGSVTNVGANGYIWSSSLYTSDPQGARYLYLGSNGCNMGYNFRYYGQSVRAVRG